MYKPAPAALSALVTLAVAILVSPSSHAARRVDRAPSPTPDRAHHTATLPPTAQPDAGLRFEANRGQTDDRVDFIVRGAGGPIFLTSREAVFRLTATAQPGTERAPVPRPSPVPGACTCATAHAPRDSAVVRLQLQGSNANARATGLGPVSGRTSYFLGSDPSNWRTNVASYERVGYRGVYPGVDLVYHGGAGSELEYDFTIAAGGDPSRIAFRAVGATNMRIDDSGNLVVATSAGELTERRPVVYQGDGADRRPVAGGFDIRGDGTIGFRVGPYDHAQPLVIDPILSYSTYLGGGGGDVGLAADVGADGSIYLAGSTDSINFPLNPASPGGTSGGTDIFITKFNPAGNGLTYSVFVGGSADDTPALVRVDGAGNTIVRGQTMSSNFPTVNAAQAAYGGNQDVVLFKLNPNGGMVYSTYIGGSAFDDCFTGLDIDAAGDAFVGGCTSSPDFPVKNAFQDTYLATATGFNTGFFAKYSPTGTLMFSSFLGGSYSETLYGIVANTDGTFIVAGAAFSTDFPVVNPIQSTLNGSADGFVAKVKADGSGLIFSTYFGGSGLDYFSRIAGDGVGAIYATGTTDSPDFPTMNAFQPAYGGGPHDSFVTKINATGTAVEYSGYLGGSQDDNGFGISVDGLGVAHVTGSTNSLDFPLADPIQTQIGGLPFDITVSSVSADGSHLTFSTYVGGSDTDFTNQSTCDKDGNIYVPFLTGSTDFPTVRAFQPTYAGGIRDAGIFKISDRYELDWDPPAADGGAPEHLVATLAEGASPGARQLATAEAPREVTGYNVYRSTSPNVQPTPANLFMQLPPTQTTTGPTAPGGSFFVVTAVYGDTQSGASNEAGAGAGAAATLSKVKVKTTKISAKGTGFTTSVQVFLGGVPFATPAVVKKGTKVTQTGNLLTGQTIGQYLAAHGNRAIVSFRNSNGAVATSAYMKP